MDELVSRLAAGEHDAFAGLYDVLADRLHHYLVALLGSRTDADDVLQETFARLARHRRNLGEVENLTGYVFRIARNEARRFAERRSRRQARETSLSADDLFVASADPARPDDAGEQIAAGLARLADEHREVIELKTYAELTFAQIAAVLELPQGTVASRYRAALARLRDVLTVDS